MPGVTLDYVETDTRAARMGGMEARYGYVTLDGNTMANTFAGGSFGADNRQFEFEAFSINNIESIEVNKTLSADMPADAPAGTSTSARRARSIAKASASTTPSASSATNTNTRCARRRAMTITRMPSRARRSPSITRIPISTISSGVSINGATTSVFQEQFRNSMTYDYTSAQALAAGHPLVTAINFKDGPKMTTKYSGGLKLDYQP